MKKLILALIFLFPTILLAQGQEKKLDSVDLVPQGDYRVRVNNSTYSSHPTLEECVEVATNLMLLNMNARCEQPAIIPRGNFSNVVIDTVYETRTIIDTTYLEEIIVDTVLETRYIVSDTIYTAIVDTTYETVYDTSYVTETIIDTVYTTVIDTLYEEVVQVDTVYQEEIVVDTVYTTVTDTLYETVVDTVYEEFVQVDTVYTTVTDTLYETVVDTLYETVTLTDTTYVTETIVDTVYTTEEIVDTVYTTETIVDTVYTTEEIVDTVYTTETIVDTVYTTEEIVDTVYTTVTDTLYETVVDTLYETVTLTDTTYVTETVVDTVYQEYVVVDTTYQEVIVSDTTYQEVVASDTVFQTEYITTGSTLLNDPRYVHEQLMPDRHSVEITAESAADSVIIDYWCLDSVESFTVIPVNGQLTHQYALECVNDLQVQFEAYDATNIYTDMITVPIALFNDLFKQDNADKVYYTDFSNFDATQWTQTWGNLTYEVVDSTLRVTLPERNIARLQWNLVPEHRNARIRVVETVDSTHGTGVHMGLRESVSDTLRQGAESYLNSNGIGVSLFVDGSWSNPINYPFAWQYGEKIEYILEVYEDEVRIKVWKHGDPMPNTFQVYKAAAIGGIPNGRVAFGSTGAGLYLIHELEVYILD